MELRHMKPEDWTEVERIYSQAIEDGNSCFRHECPSFVQWDESHDQRCRYLATQGEDVLGWVALSPISSQETYSGIREVSIYIDFAHHHKGIGRRLIEKVVDDCKHNDIWMLQVAIYGENTPSIALHEKCGFRMVGYRERMGKDIFGQWRDIVLMEYRYEDG